MSQRNPMMTAQRYSSNPQKFNIPVANSMNPSEEELPPFPDPEISSIQLDHKPGAKLNYTYYPASSRKNANNPFSQTLIVYLNGLMLPRSSWDASIHSFLEKRIVGRLPYPGLLSYDRYGQDQSDHDPFDKDPPPCHGHDAMSAVQDLKQLILQIWREHLDMSKPTHFPTLIFVCNSIGCALARLFTQQHPGTVSGLLFLDSIMANSDQQSIWPDPDAPDFNPQSLPEGVSVEDVRHTRKAYHEMFHPDVPNMEGLSRRNLAQLLPDADRPRLEGYLGQGPYLTVCGHDWETFAEQSCTLPLSFSSSQSNPFLSLPTVPYCFLASPSPPPPFSKPLFTPCSLQSITCPNQAPFQSILFLPSPTSCTNKVECSHRPPTHPQAPHNDLRQPRMAQIQRRPNLHHRHGPQHRAHCSRRVRTLYSTRRAGLCQR
jgi:pimeloyl-ACP methyl ester carboxylesterase